MTTLIGVQVDPFSLLHPRLRELASAAAKTATWISDNDKAIPALVGAAIQVDSTTTVAVSMRNEPYGWLELADDEQSFTAYGVDLDDPAERHLVADRQVTMPVALFALTVWHAQRMEAAFQAAAERAAETEPPTDPTEPEPEPPAPDPEPVEPVIDPPDPPEVPPE